MKPMQQSTFNQTVAAEIRAELGRQGLTQSELARRLGWAQSALSRRLGSQLPFSTDDLEDISSALGLAAPGLTLRNAAAS